MFEQRGEKQPLEVFCKTLAQVFSCEFCKIFKNIFLAEHLQVTVYEGDSLINP